MSLGGGADDDVAVGADVELVYMDVVFVCAGVMGGGISYLRWRSLPVVMPVRLKFTSATLALSRVVPFEKT